MIANPLGSRLVGFGLLALGWIGTAGAASAQVECTTVMSGLEPPGADGQVFALCEYDDGTGTALYAGGSFRIAGDAVAACIVRFDGAHWSALGAGLASNGFSGITPTVLDLVVFDFGAGPRLVASGIFDVAGGQPAQNVAVWDGTSWTAIDTLPGPARSLAVFDDGGGARLFAAAGNDVERWNGVTWDVLPSPGGGAADLEVHDDGAGPALYAGGWFGVNVSVKRWTGAGWVTLGIGPLNGVSTLASHDDGSGRKLYAGCAQTSASTILRWSGTSWDPVGALSSTVRALEELDLEDGQGPRLYAGLLSPGAPPARIVRWSGSAWSDVASGELAEARALTAFGAGPARRLYAGVSVRDATTTTSVGLSRAEGSAWIPAHPGRGLVGNSVAAFAQHDFGAGEEILAGGSSLLGPPSLVGGPIARWTGGGWIDAGPVPNPASVLTLESFELGGTRELFAGVQGNGLWRWNGAAWLDVPSDLFYAVEDLQVFTAQGQTRLAAAGHTISFPNVRHALVRTWNGSAWTTIASHASPSFSNALAAFDDGSGPALYCGGYFAGLGGAAGTNGIARWDGAIWSSVGGGLALGGSIASLVVFDDGSGPALYAGGQFDAIGGAPIADIARWDGTAWSPVGASGTSGWIGDVLALAVHDGGAGPRLWAGGDFTSIGGVAARNLARWDGTAWTPAAGDADGAVTALASFDEQVGSARTLWAAGDFVSIGGVASSRVARIGCATGDGFPFCFGDAAHGSSACPCANPGATGHGCAVPASPAGAILGTTGSTAPTTPGGVETLALVASDLPGTTTAVFVQGTRTSPAPFGDGILCLGAPLVRLATKHASGGVARYPEPGDAPLSQRGATPFGSGVTRGYQVWFRAASTYCNAGNYGTSSGRAITW